MFSYYNEIDPTAAMILRGLIDNGHIAPGVVDTRDIRDVKPSDLKFYSQCHFFAGVGVWSYALRCAGWSDQRPVWTGSCPCQPFSTAGAGGGFNDERHLWPAFEHLIRECQPTTIFGEQVASQNGLEWIDLVQSDMEAANYAFAAVDMCAAGFGAPHIRQRLWWVADTLRPRRERLVHNRGLFGGTGSSQPVDSDPFADAWCALVGDFSNLRKRDGASASVERNLLRCFGNAIAAPVAKAFIEAVMEND